MRTAFTLTLLVAGATACATTDDAWAPGADEQEIEPGTDGKADGEGCEITSLASLDAALGYRELEPGSASTYYRMGATRSSTVRLDGGAQPDFSFYFLPGNRVIIEYAELQAQGGGSYQKTNETFVIAPVTMDANGVVHLGDVARGMSLTETDDGHCFTGLALTLERDIHAAGLAGTTTNVYKAASSRWAVDPDDLDAIPNEDGRAYYKQAIADGTIKVIRR